MAHFIGIPLKRTSDTDLFTPLKQLIEKQYANLDNYYEPLEKLNKLRKDATFKGIEGKSTTTLTALQRYSDQLRSFMNKLPQNEVPIDFKWRDAFEKPGYSFLGGSSSVVILSLAYEKVCVLFNLAASYSDVAATALNEDVHNEHALQLAAKYFQIAAGIFLELKTQSPIALGQRTPPTDLNPSILEILHFLMLAQAQEATFVKAAAAGMSGANLAKLAAQCSEYYGECYKLIQIVKSLWPDKDWFNMIHSKQYCYLAIAHFHQSSVAGSASKYGEEIAWLNHSLDSYRQAETFCPLSDYLVGYQKKTVKRHEEAVKENDFIYHARVPEYKALEVVERFSLVKPAPLAERFAPDSTDLFEDLPLLKLQQKVDQKSEPPKQEMSGSELASLKQATTTLNSILATLNLPTSLEGVIGANLPQTLIDKSKGPHPGVSGAGGGGLDRAKHLIHELPELRKRNVEIIDQVEQSIQEEERRDEHQRQIYGSRWTRTPSSVLNKVWKENVNKYRNIIKNAIAADEKVIDKLQSIERSTLPFASDSSSTASDLVKHSEEGTKFYNDLTQLLVKMQTSVNDYCLARRTELDDLTRLLQGPSYPPVDR